MLGLSLLKAEIGFTRAVYFEGGGWGEGGVRFGRWSNRREIENLEKFRNLFLNTCCGHGCGRPATTMATTFGRFFRNCTASARAARGHVHSSTIDSSSTRVLYLYFSLCDKCRARQIHSSTTPKQKTVHVVGFGKKILSPNVLR